jgi:hypothetical protein
VAPLQRAVALAQMHRAALAVAEDLHLDMARPPEVFLDIDLVIAEGGLCLGPRGAEGGFQLIGGPGELHAAPAAARRRLDDDRVADLGGDRLSRLQVGTPPSEPGTQGTPRPASFPWR